jgi:hypothetical protein
MFWEETLIIVVGTIGFTLTLMCPFIINRVAKYKIEIEKIRQEAEVRKEEIRCRNQLELEKYMVNERKKDGAERGYAEPASDNIRDRIDARPVDVDTAAKDSKRRKRASGMEM